MPTWLIMVAVGVGVFLLLWLFGYLVGPQNGNTITKRDQRILDQRALVDQTPTPSVEAAADELASLRYTKVEDWLECPACHGSLLYGLPDVVQCASCPRIYSNQGVQPRVSTDPSTYGLVFDTERYFPVTPSYLGRRFHPLVWMVRPPGMSVSFPLLLPDLELEERAFGPPS